MMEEIWFEKQLEQFFLEKEYERKIQLAEKILQYFQSNVPTYKIQIQKVKEVAKNHLEQFVSTKYQKVMKEKGIEEVVFDQGTMQDLGMDMHGFEEGDFVVTKVVIDQNVMTQLIVQYETYNKMNSLLKVLFRLACKMQINSKQELIGYENDKKQLKDKCISLQENNEQMKKQFENVIIEKEKLENQLTKLECVNIGYMELYRGLEQLICEITNENYFLEHQIQVIEGNSQDIYLVMKKHVELIRSFIIKLREENENLNNTHRALEEKMKMQEEGMEKEYLTLLKEKEELEKSIKIIRQKDKCLTCRYNHSHKRYHDDELYKKVIRTVWKYDKQRGGRKKALDELLKTKVVQDFLAEGTFKLVSTSQLIELYDIAVTLVGEQMGIRVEKAVKLKKTRKKLGLE